MNYHVYPLKDSAPHNTESDICPCNPRIVDGLVIHNSFDKRESKREYLLEVILRHLTLLFEAHEKYIENDKIENESKRIRLNSLAQLKEMINIYLLDDTEGKEAGV